MSEIMIHELTYRGRELQKMEGRWLDGNLMLAAAMKLAEQPALQDSETIAQTFTGLPKRKLRDLLAAGWQVNGVCFQRTEENGVVRRGAATTGGMVLWWNAEQPAQQQEPVAKVPGMAVQALAGEIIEALLADEKDGGYDLTAGLFGSKFSALVRRWAAAEWNTFPQPAQQELVTQSQVLIDAAVLRKALDGVEAVTHKTGFQAGHIRRSLAPLRIALDHSTAGAGDSRICAGTETSPAPGSDPS